MSYPKDCLLYFSTESCGLCKELGKNLKEVKINGEIFYATPDENSDIFEEFNINSVPVVILIKEGKELDRFYGIKNSETIERFFEG